VPIEEVREKVKEGKKRREWKRGEAEGMEGMEPERLGLDGGKRRSECYRSERETEKGRC